MKYFQQNQDMFLNQALEFGTAIKNASFNVTASVFVPVDNFTAEATPTLSEDKW